MKTAAKPEIGSIVHYVSYGTPGGEYGRECRAAVVTEVQGDPAESVGLCVLNPEGQFFKGAIPFMAGHKPDADEPSALCNALCCHGGTWHWPAGAS
jgi:hypothetical protein